MGNPIDNKGPILGSTSYYLYGKPLGPLERKMIKEPLDVGIGAINSMITLGRGQRIAIMAGSGVGKSVLMGMMTKHTNADVVVIGLIGERGREVKDFVEETLGEEGLKRAVLVAAVGSADMVGGVQLVVAERCQIGRIEPIHGPLAGRRATCRSIAGGTSYIHSDYSGVVM